MKQTFRWQPDLAGTLIYWSLTFFILFFSLVMALENTKPYPESIAVTIVALFFIVIGNHRFIKITDQQLIIYYARFWKKTRIPLSSDPTIHINGKHLMICYDTGQFEAMMAAKTQQRLLASIKNIQKNSNA